MSTKVLIEGKLNVLRPEEMFVLELYNSVSLEVTEDNYKRNRAGHAVDISDGIITEKFYVLKNRTNGRYVSRWHYSAGHKELKITEHAKRAYIFGSLDIIERQAKFFPPRYKDRYNIVEVNASLEELTTEDNKYVLDPKGIVQRLK